MLGLGSFSITPMDGSLVAIVVMVVQWVKKQHRVKLNDFQITIIPFLVSWVLSIPVIFIADQGTASLWVFVAQVFWEGLKSGLIAGGVYKISKEFKKTVQSSGSDSNGPKDNQ
jgi:cell division protein FtsW (lipid II flippase)